MLTYAAVCRRMPTYADVCCRMPTYADVCLRMLASAAGLPLVRRLSVVVWLSHHLGATLCRLLRGVGGDDILCQGEGAGCNLSVAVQQLCGKLDTKFVRGCRLLPLCCSAAARR